MKPTKQQALVLSWCLIVVLSRPSFLFFRHFFFAAVFVFFVDMSQLTEIDSTVLVQHSPTETFQFTMKSIQLN